MEGTGIGKDLTQIAVALIGVALIALLVGHASQTAGLIGTGVSGFNSLLQTVTLQSSFGGGMASSFMAPTSFGGGMIA